MATAHQSLTHSSVNGGIEGGSSPELSQGVNPSELKGALTALAGDTLRVLGISGGISAAVIAGGVYWLSKVEMFASHPSVNENIANGIQAMLGIR